MYPQKQTTTPLKSSSADRNWRGVRVSQRDSYLDAFEHSQTSKDPREGIISTDVKPKIPKLIRRDYSEGPVYRHPHEQYGGPKESSSSYSLPQEVNNRLTTTKNIARISYGGPTPEPFYPTPSDSYSLPIQSSVNFNHRDNNGFYESPQFSYGSPSPQLSYGSPSPQTQIYTSPNNNYNKAPTVPHNSYGPPNNGYPPAGIPQQGEARGSVLAFAISSLVCPTCFSLFFITLCYFFFHFSISTACLYQDHFINSNTEISQDD